MTAAPMPSLGTIGHVDPPHKGDWLGGLQHTHSRGFTCQDVNGHVTKDGHFVPAHYEDIAKLHMHDPAGRLPKHAKISNLTLAQVEGLRPDEGGDRRLTAITNWMPWMAANGMAVELEWKPDPHAIDIAGKLACRRLHDQAEATGAVVVVAVLQCWAPKSKQGAARTAALNSWEKAAKARARTASAAGLPTMLLWRRKVSADWVPLLSGIKGGPARKGIAHLGNGASRVTKHGGTVTATQLKAANARIRKLGGKFPPHVKATPATPPPATSTSTPPVVRKPPVALTSVQKVTATARKYVGLHEGRSGGHWNNDNPFAKKMGFANRQAWCATFVCAVFKEAGLLSLIRTPSAGVDQLSVGFKRDKRWSEYPALGAIVFFGKPSDLNHTGIVIAYDADTITTVEGNTNDTGSPQGDGVYLLKHRRRDVRVVGYGYPRYAEGIVSADPAWSRQAPTKATTPVDGAPAPSPPVTGPPAGFQPHIDGVDISHWQSGAMDLAKAKAAGVKFIFHKATEHSSYRDPKYSARRKQAAAAGIPFGGYHFARPGRSSGAVQARFFLKVATPKPGGLLPMLDLEDRGGLNASQLQRWVDDFVAEVRRQTGKPPLLYTNFDLQRDPGCFLWVARYNNANALPKTPSPWVRWSIWQFSNGTFGKPKAVPGIGPCDINVLFPGFTVDRITL
jgi:GH25 family lysozyme M1 (1,4-beta-N-acetylmuramidase)